MPEETRTEERYKRIRFIKRLLRPLPRRTNVHRYPILKWFALSARRRAYLWSFRVSAMTPAFYAGSVIALLPILGVQVLLALVVAVVVKANLPTIVGLQMITNPLTAVPIYLFLRKTGLWLMDLLNINLPSNVYGRGVSAMVIGAVVIGLMLGAVLDGVYRFLAYEANKHHWHLPRLKRNLKKDSASPVASDGHKD